MCLTVPWCLWGGKRVMVVIMAKTPVQDKSSSRRSFRFAQIRRRTRRAAVCLAGAAAAAWRELPPQVGYKGEGAGFPCGKGVRHEQSSAAETRSPGRVHQR